MSPGPGPGPKTGLRPRRPGNGVPAPDEDDLAVLHVAYASTRDRQVRNRLAEGYDSFAVALARRFPTRRESFEDLAQVARVGLLGAIDRFDPDRGRPFLAFAGVTITGELKRHVRDRTWAVRVPRALQEHYLVVVRAVEELTLELGRSPRIGEVAARSGLTDEQVLEAMELGANQRPESLDRPDGGGSHLEPGRTDHSFARVEDRMLVASLVGSLPEHHRQVLCLHFVDGLTQSQIAVRMGRSQMYVSRLLARILAQLETRAGAPGRGPTEVAVR